MVDRTLKEEARLYFVPYILGNTRAAHKLAYRIYRKFGIISVICDRRRSLCDLFDPTSRPVVLSSTDSPRLIAEQLVELTRQTQYTLPLIIPVCEEYERMAQSERATLEHSFVICDAQTLFERSPLADIPR